MEKAVQVLRNDGVLVIGWFLSDGGEEGGYEDTRRHLDILKKEGHHLVFIGEGREPDGDGVFLLGLPRHWFAYRLIKKGSPDWKPADASAPERIPESAAGVIDRWASGSAPSNGDLDVLLPRAESLGLASAAKGMIIVDNIIAAAESPEGARGIARALADRRKKRGLEMPGVGLIFRSLLYGAQGAVEDVQKSHILLFVVHDRDVSRARTLAATAAGMGFERLILAPATESAAKGLSRLGLGMTRVLPEPVAQNGTLDPELLAEQLLQPLSGFENLSSVSMTAVVSEGISLNRLTDAAIRLLPSPLIRNALFRLLLLPLKPESLEKTWNAALAIARSA
jgi:hypothetical protein